MIDLQNKELTFDVFSLYTKFELFFNKESRPIFLTKQLEDGTWSCSVDIPDLETVTVEGLETEVKAINKCARDVHHALYRYEDDDGIYYPGIERSDAKQCIEAFFDNVEYSKEYTYQICSETIDLSTERKSLKNRLADLLMIDEEKLAKEGKELYKISDYISVTYLIRRKKKNYC